MGVNPIIVDVDQRSEAWRMVRLGKLTGTGAGDMLATIKSGEAAKRRDLRIRLVLERITQRGQEDGYVNADMQRGIDLEPAARTAYEAATGHLVASVGFLQHPKMMAGVSPDGLVGTDGGVELKCPKSATHLQWLRSGGVPAEHLHQVRHSLWVSGRDWWDFASFDERFPEPLQLFVARLWRNDAELDAYELAVSLFLSEVDREEAAVRAIAQTPVGA